MAAANLIQAAGQSYNNLFTLWSANTLKAHLNAFWADVNPIFDEQLVQDQPCGNWVVLLADLGTNMPAASVPFSQLNAGAQYVYRLCWLTQALVTLNQITGAQGVAVLAAYNAHIA